LALLQIILISLLSAVSNIWSDADAWKFLQYRKLLGKNSPRHSFADTRSQKVNEIQTKFAVVGLSSFSHPFYERTRRFLSYQGKIQEKLNNKVLIQKMLFFYFFFFFSTNKWTPLYLVSMTMRCYSNMNKYGPTRGIIVKSDLQIELRCFQRFYSKTESKARCNAFCFHWILQELNVSWKHWIPLLRSNRFFEAKSNRLKIILC